VVSRVPAATPAADPVRWPDVATVPAAPLRAAVARVAFARAAGRLGLTVTGPEGGQDGNGPTLVIRRPYDLFRRLGGDGPTGFAEAYMAGDWDTPALADLLTVLGTGYSQLVPGTLGLLRPLLIRRRPASEDQTITGSRHNIELHYDLPEAMFAAFLDETMTYSCALFGDAPDEPPSGEGTLALAQRRKIDAILDLAGVTAGTRLLEIGTGWGELAIVAARRGATVVTISNSPLQHQAASRRVRAAGAQDGVTVELRDYREVSSQFDAVVSVEMIEAVGAAYWPAFFGAIDAALAPGGRVALQAITLPHRRMRQVSRGYSWMDKYIFPGAVIPSRRAIETTLARHTSLRVTRVRPMAAHYARTLQAWRERFTGAHGDIVGLGFDEVFCRMWQFYLAYCEAGFRAQLVDVGQFLLERQP
jgi:cyclopropane-fatty-acyl-phospholipid synthase